MKERMEEAGSKLQQSSWDYLRGSSLEEFEEWIRQETLRKEKLLREKQQEQAQWEYRQQRKRMIAESQLVYLEQQKDFSFDPAGRIPSRELYEQYILWCREKEVPAQSEKALMLALKKHYPVKQVFMTAGGRRCRGYAGLRRCNGCNGK